MLVFAIGSSSLAIRPPEEKVAGARILFDHLHEKAYSRAIEVGNLQHVSGHIEHFSTSNSMWKLVTGPIDALLRYTDECDIWVSCPVLAVWRSFLRSKKVIST